MVAGPAMKGWMAMARRALHDGTYWAEHVARQQASGLSVREYCQQASLQAHHFYYWRKRITSSESASSQRRPASAKPDCQSTVTSQATGAISPTTSNMSADLSQTVVVRLGDCAAVHVPAQMLDTIEAILKMAMRISEPAIEASSFRSIIVRT